MQLNSCCNTAKNSRDIWRARLFLPYRQVAFFLKSGGGPHPKNLDESKKILKRKLQLLKIVNILISTGGCGVLYWVPSIITSFSLFIFCLWQLNFKLIPPKKWLGKGYINHVYQLFISKFIFKFKLTLTFAHALPYICLLYMVRK